MSGDAVKTLFHPFRTGILGVPQRRVLFLGAEPGFRAPEDFTDDLTLVQGFRPWFKALAGAGYRVVPIPEGEGYDAATVLLGRHRGFNEVQIAEAVRRVKPGGLVMAAGSTQDGAGSLRDALAKGTDRVPLAGSLSKYHGIAFWFEAGPEAGRFADAVMVRQADLPLVETRFRTSPGMFSCDRIDRGSAVLAQHLPADLSGRVADFGAGWGYLAAAILEHCPAIESLDLYEADFASLEAAKANLTGRVPMAFHWHDLTSEPVEKRFHAIVMNPPFHTGRAAEPALGQAFIVTAAKALVPKGRLLLVANNGLPYERTIAEKFSTQREICRQDGFKVIEAVR